VAAVRRRAPVAHTQVAGHTQGAPVAAGHTQGAPEVAGRTQVVAPSAAHTQGAPVAAGHTQGVAMPADRLGVHRRLGGLARVVAPSAAHTQGAPEEAARIPVRAGLDRTVVPVEWSWTYLSPAWAVAISVTGQAAMRKPIRGVVTRPLQLSSIGS